MYEIVIKSNKMIFGTTEVHLHSEYDYFLRKQLRFHPIERLSLQFQYHLKELGSECRSRIKI